ncbi:MAG TPA: hypothetical protein DEF61_02305 [Firmicutes bacterium]|nr:hypothetical protein [Bacillota bacterium]
MESPKKVVIRQVVSSLHKNKRKNISLDYLSKIIGIYPDVLGAELSYFCPMILMDPSVNVRDYLEDMRRYLSEPSKNVSKKKSIKEKRERIYKKELEEYKGIVDFIYKKMTTVGGLLDPGFELDRHEIRIMEKLLQMERKKLRNKKKKQ